MATTEEKLLTAIAALERIKSGSAITGRWVEQFGVFSAIDDATDPKIVPDGYYDQAEPPEEDNTEPEPPVPNELADSTIPLEDLRLVNGVYLVPARWEAYDGEEQDHWVLSCADIATQALNTIQAPEPPKATKWHVEGTSHFATGFDFDVEATNQGEAEDIAEEQLREKYLTDPLYAGVDLQEVCISSCYEVTDNE